MRDNSYFGPMMVYMGDADAYVSGITHNYPEIIRPALQIVGTTPGIHKVAGMYVMIARDKVYFFVIRRSILTQPPPTWPKSPFWPPMKCAVGILSRA